MNSTARRVLMFVGLICLTGIAAISMLTESRWNAPQPQSPDLSITSTEELIARVSRGVAPTLTGQRPLFLSSRRPYVPPVALTEPDAPLPPDPFPDVELLGIFGSGPHAGVLLRHEGKTARIALGARWTGWELKDIDPQTLRVTFASRDRGEHVLLLRRLPQTGELVLSIESEDGQQKAGLPETGVDGAQTMEADVVEQVDQDGEESFLVDGAR